MICPRCGNEWDASKSPCTRCGLVVRLPGGSTGRSSLPTQRGHGQPGTLPPIKQQSGRMSPTLASNISRPATSIPGPGPAQTSGPLYPSVPLPNTPRPFAVPSASVQSTPSPSLSKPATPSPKGDTLEKMSTLAKASIPSTDTLSPRNAAARALLPPRVSRFTDQLTQDRSQPLRARRLVTDSLYREKAQPGQSPFPSPASSSRPESHASSPGVHVLLPGTILHGGRYRLNELQRRQEWAPGVYEAMWLGQDAQRGRSQVMICEVVLPESTSVAMQSKLRAATMALASIGRHPHIAALWDAFSDQRRTFFVFEPSDGETLFARMHRTGHALSEQEVLECCLQMTEVLELLMQQMPPIVHGLIRPEHIIAKRTGSQYVLTNFSIVLAGGATQFITGSDRSRLSAYTASELVRGVIDVRSDLYSLIATAYHLVTGSPPTETAGSIPPAQRLNPMVSQQFEAILVKGLRPLAGQRYQRPAELLQDLLAVRSVSGSLASPRGGNRQWAEQSVLPEPHVSANAINRVPTDSVVQTLPILLTPAEDIEEQSLLLPRPEELPPLADGNDTRNAILWLGVLLVCLILIVVASGPKF